jgi:CheY-like chemotaxis protein
MNEISAPLKVLVADEDKDIRFLIRIHLRDYNAKVTEARDGSAAYDLINAQKPDLIILNYMLDKISGYELADKLSKNEELKDIPVIILTLEGFDLYEDKSGVDDYLAKPFLKEQFLSVVGKFIDLEKYKKTEEEEEISREKKSRPKEERAPGSGPSSSIKILAADDEEDIIKLLKLILAGYDLDIATSGEELVEKALSSRDYDLIISDVVMPGLSGWKSIKKIRAEGMDCPVIFNSGLVKDMELYETLKPEGESKFILKPFKKADLLRAVEELTT